MPDQNQNYNSKTIAFLKAGLTAFYPDVAKDYFKLGKVSLPHLKSWGGFESSMDFVQFLFDVTETDSVEDAAQWISNTSLGKVERDIPVNIQYLVEQLDEAQTKKASAYEQRQKAKDLERVAQEHRERNVGVKLPPKEVVKPVAEKIYLKADEIKVPELDDTTESEFKSRVVEAKSDPKYNEKLAQEIYKANKDTVPAEQLDQLKVTSQVLAADLTNKLVSIDTTQPLTPQIALLDIKNPVHVLASLADPNNPKLKELIPNKAERLEFCKAAQKLLIVQEHDNINVAQKFFAKLLPEKIVMSLYPGIKNLQTFSITDKQDGSHYIVNWRETIATYKQYSNVLDKLPIGASLTSYESEMLAYFSAKGIPSLAPDLAGILASPQFSNVAVSSLISFRAESFAFSGAVLSEGQNMVGQAFGVNLGERAIQLTTLAGENVLKTALGVGTKAATKTVASAAVGTVAKTGLIAGLSAILPGLGTFLGKALGWVGEKLMKLLQDNKKLIPIFGLLIAGIGGIIGNTLMTFGGLGFSALTFFGQPGVAAAMSSVGGAILGAIGSIAISVSTTAVVIIISFPVVIALILFIINSGAYIVPPKLSSLSTPPGATIISPYIDVSKVASPVGPFQNSDLPITIKYTITITAKKGALTNIKIAYDCKVIKKGSPLVCPSIDPKVPGSITIPDTISPAQPFSFEYTQVIKGSEFNDTLVSDTLTVTADEAEQIGAVAAASLGIKIGNPPDTCPSGWPLDGSYDITQGPKGGFSHALIEAMDLAAGTGTPVKATHSGIAHVVYTSGAYRPVYVDISSNCGGAFSSRYAHLSVVSVKNGQAVTMGQVIGLSGSDGTGPHLHYEFIGLKMAPPNIPKSVPYGCSDNCGKIP